MRGRRGGELAPIICSLVVTALLLSTSLPPLLTLVSSATWRGVNGGAHAGGAVIYVVGGLSSFLRLHEELMVSNLSLVKLTKLSTVPGRAGVIVVTRMLEPEEERVLVRCLLRGFVIVSVGRDVSDQVRGLLSRVVTVTALFNGTEAYAYKIISMQRVHGHYPVLIVGYGGKPSAGILVDAARLLRVRVLSLSPGCCARRVAIIKWDSNNAAKPHGKLVISHEIYEMLNNAIPNTEDYVVKCYTEIISGNKLGWWDSSGYSWFNDYIKSKYLLTYYTKRYSLINYEPTSMSNVGTSVEVSIEGPCLSWSYSGKYILSIDDDSDLGANVAGWYHDIGTLLLPGVPNTVEIDPGFEFLVSPAGPGRQRWVITAGWVGMGVNPEMPLKHFALTLVMVVNFNC